MDKYEKLAELIEDVVNITDDGLAWEQKAQKVKDACGEMELEEFLAWFPEEEEGK